ncbi:MAG: NAD-dependent epimerase/dehydratase family protein, partial [Vibrio sp.]
MKVLLTGSTGFVGNAVAVSIQAQELRLLGRRPSNVEGFFCKAELNKNEDYSEYLENINVVIHIAARTHSMNDSVDNSLESYREINTCGTVNLARQAAKAGVKRFIFISSIKVNGESTILGEPFRADNFAQPEDDYGISKSEAEQELFAIAQETGMEVVVIRPTLVYGVGVKANFASLMNLVSKGIPLPFGCINHNKRSLVSVDNLVDLIITCMDHP